jgi:hypothetical protein
MKETNTDPKAGTGEKRSIPGIFDGLAEQNMSRARENIEKLSCKPIRPT